MAFTSLTSATALAATPYNGGTRDWSLFQFHAGPYIGTAGNGITLGATSYPLFQCWQPTDIVGIYVRQGTAAAGAACTLRFYHAPTGTALASGTAMSAAEDIQAAALAVNTVGAIDLTASSYTGIPVGSVLGFVCAGTPTAVVGLQITILARRAATLTPSGGNSQYHNTAIA